MPTLSSAQSGPKFPFALFELYALLIAVLLFQMPLLAFWVALLFSIVVPDASTMMPMPLRNELFALMNTALLKLAIPANPSFVTWFDITVPVASTPVPDVYSMPTPLPAGSLVPMMVLLITSAEAKAVG